MSDQEKVDFNLLCFITGHKYINGNNENDYNWCDRCFKEARI